MRTSELIVVGDIAFTGKLARDPLASVKAIDPSVMELLNSGAVVGNLEGPLVKDVPGGDLSFPKAASPMRCVEALKALNIRVLSLANNHILDYGDTALRQTLDVLDAAGIAHFGAGMNIQEALKPAMLEVGGARIKLMGFDGSYWRATRRKPGCVPLGSEIAREAIRRARQSCDMLVVYFHQGVEALNYPLRSTMKACHDAVDSGADLVVGSHPHTVQGIEAYKEVPIVYSVGNFILPLADGVFFDTWYSQTTLPRLGHGFDRGAIMRAMVLRCFTVACQRFNVEGVPIIVDESGLPRRPQATDRQASYEFLVKLCEAFQSPRDPGWAFRDEIERGHNRLLLSAIRWSDVMRRFTDLRWRHVAELSRILYGAIRVDRTL